MVRWSSMVICTICLAGILLGLAGAAIFTIGQGEQELLVRGPMYGPRPPLSSLV